MNEKIIAFVNEVHSGQMYGEHTYDYHLDAVEQVLAEAGMDSDDDRVIARSHDAIEDIIEDRREEAIAFFRAETSEHAFNTIWALSGFGENRKARNADAYAKIAAYPRSADYKVADRIVNMENSRAGNQRKYAMYLAESEAFEANVVALATNQILVDRYHAAKSPPN